MVKKHSYCYCVFHGKSCLSLFYPLQENELDLFDTFDSPENTKAGQVCAKCYRENIAPFRNEVRLFFIRILADSKTQIFKSKKILLILINIFH